MKILPIIAAAAALVLLPIISANAATEAELRTQCEESGGTLDTSANPWECKHDGPAADLTAPAPQAMVNTFEFEGKVWTIVDGPPSAVSAVHMTPGAEQACPSRRVKLETSDGGPEQTAAQRFRGDQRWHVLCVR